MIDYLNGEREVIHDCMAAPEICMIDDPRVSPDSKNIIYWVGIGSELRDVRAFGTNWNTGAKDIAGLNECQLWVYNIAKKQKTQISGGHCDRSADWIDNDTIVFSSNRGMTFPRFAKPPGNFYPFPSFQIHRGDIVRGKLANIENLTPHACMALNPMVATDGTVPHSELQCGIRSLLTSTPQNYLYIASIDTNGADGKSLLGFHHSPTLRSSAYRKGIDPTGSNNEEGVKALRVVSELTKGVYAASNYYRGNHQGANGQIIGWKAGQGEGAVKAADIIDATYKSSLEGSGMFMRRSTRLLTPFGESQDTAVKRHPNGKVMGKTGYPAPHPDGKFMFTWCRGECYEVAAARNTRKYTGGEPTAQRVIALALVDVVTDPFDPKQLKIISQDNDYHRYNAQPITTYQALYGQPIPTPIPRLTGTTTALVVKDARAHQIIPQPGKTTKLEREVLQGNIEPDYATKAHSFCVDYYLPNLSAPTSSKPEIKRINEKDPRKKYEIIGMTVESTDCTDIQPNGSVFMELEPNKPVQMYVTDNAGEELSRDHSMHSLRKGEVRECDGCHDGHSEQKADI